jgi:hypothetical protein
LFYKAGRGSVFAAEVAKGDEDGGDGGNRQAQVERLERGEIFEDPFGEFDRHYQDGQAAQADFEIVQVVGNHPFRQVYVADEQLVDAQGEDEQCNGNQEDVDQLDQVEADQLAPPGGEEDFGDGVEGFNAALDETHQGGDEQGNNSDQGQVTGFFEESPHSSSRTGSSR